MLALVLVAGFAARARADAPLEIVCLRFEGPWSAPLAAQVDADLRTAFGRRDVKVCERDGAPALRETAPELTLTIDAETLDHVGLTLDPRTGPPLERALKLTPFPADGRVLALVVAADELLQASRERPAPETAAPAKPSPAAPPPPVKAPEPTTTIVQAPAAPTRPTSRSLAAGFALDHYAGGQTQLGPDLTFRVRLGDGLLVAAAAQARRGLTADATTGTVTSRLVGGRLALGARLWAGDRAELTADAGVRAGRIWLEGDPNAGGAAVGSTAAGWLAYADLTLALDLRLGGPIALRLDGRVGAPLVAQAAAEGTREVTAAAGLALGAEAALLMVF